MPSRRQLDTALQCLIDKDGHANETCEACPYLKYTDFFGMQLPECRRDAIYQDIQDYLKEVPEARPLEYTDIVNLPIDSLIWVEIRVIDKVVPEMRVSENGDYEGGRYYTIMDRLDNPPWAVRFWSAKPTDEQRKRRKWPEESEDWYNEE